MVQTWSFGQTIVSNLPTLEKIQLKLDESGFYWQYFTVGRRLFPL